MQRLQIQTTSLFHQVSTEFRLFWRSRQTIYLAFLVPMLGMALFVWARTRPYWVASRR